MNNKFITQLFLLLTAIFNFNYASNAQDINDKRNDLEKASLKGKIMSYKESTFLTKDKFGEIMKGELKNNPRLWKFNKNGFKTEVLFVRLSTGVQMKFEICTYDEHENFSKLELFDEYGSEGLRPSTTFIMKYDNNNNMIERSEYDREGNLQTKWIYTYNSSNKLNEVIEFDGRRYDDGGNFSSRKQYQYNNGKVSSEIEFESLGSSVGNKTNYVYDSRGNLLYQVNEYNTKKNISKYNDKNQLIEFQESDGYNKYKYKYDDRGNMIEAFEYKIEYNYKNNISVQEEVLVEKIFYQYKYDEKGNWTQRMKTVNVIPTEIIEREITYYE